MCLALSPASCCFTLTGAQHTGVLYYWYLYLPRRQGSIILTYRIPAAVPNDCGADGSSRHLQVDLSIHTLPHFESFLLHSSPVTSPLSTQALSHFPSSLLLSCTTFWALSLYAHTVSHPPTRAPSDLSYIFKLGLTYCVVVLLASSWRLTVSAKTKSEPIADETLVKLADETVKAPPKMVIPAADMRAVSLRKHAATRAGARTATLEAVYPIWTCLGPYLAGRVVVARSRRRVGWGPRVD